MDRRTKYDRRRTLVFLERKCSTTRYLHAIDHKPLAVLRSAIATRLSFVRVKACSPKHLAQRGEGQTRSLLSTLRSESRPQPNRQQHPPPPPARTSWPGACTGARQSSRTTDRPTVAADSNSPLVKRTYAGPDLAVLTKTNLSPRPRRHRPPPVRSNIDADTGTNHDIDGRRL